MYGVLTNSVLSCKEAREYAAHLVAKNAYSIVDDIVWVEEDPCFAKQALIHNVNFMVPLLWKVYAFPIKKKKK